MFPVSLAAEFPNDNALLHLGAVWICRSPCAEARAVRRLSIAELSTAETATTETPTAETPTTETSKLPKLEPSRAGGGVRGYSRLVSAMQHVAADRGADDVVVAIGNVLVATRLDQKHVPPRLGAQLLGAGWFQAVASGFRVTPDFAGERAAWQALLDGSTERFDSSTELLDAWAARVLSTLLGLGEIEAIRRELRAQGVAAFGLIEAAA